MTGCLGRYFVAPFFVMAENKMGFMPGLITKISPPKSVEFFTLLVTGDFGPTLDITSEEGPA